MQVFHPTVVIVDDHPAILNALERDFNRKLDVVGCATNAALALNIIRQELPDLCLLDICMPGRDAFDAAAEIVELGTKVLFLTGGHRENYLDRAIASGASGIANKGTETSNELCFILFDVANGGSYWSPEWEARRIEIEQRGQPLSPVARMTPTQIEIIQAIICGKSPADIAKSLGMSDREVRQDLSRARKSLGAENNCQLSAKATAEGLVFPEFCSVTK